MGSKNGTQGELMHPVDDLGEYLNKMKKYFNEHWMARVTPVDISEYDKIKTIGAGTFGTVMLVRKKETGEYMAMKLLEKEMLLKQKQITHCLNEKRILQGMNFPFTIYMKGFIQDSCYIYFILPFIMGGELYRQLKKQRKFDEEQAKFYAAQVILALEYLHYLDLVYRDLKAENILFDHNGYIKITDFGFCKMVKSRTWTFCGTPEYLAPEIVLCKGYGKSVDWWSMGILLYEMCAGYTPFWAMDTNATLQKITTGKYHCPNHFSHELKDILKNILVIDLSKRYGNLKNGADDVKTHKWFRSIGWLEILNQKVEAPFAPKFRNPGDVSNFQNMDEIIIKTFCKEDQEQFQDF